MIVMALFGQPAAGKDAFKNAILHELMAEELFYRKFHAVIRRDQMGEIVPVEPAQHKPVSTPAATRQDYRIPSYIELKSSRPVETINLVVFNTAGEENQTSWQDLAIAAPFIPETDVLVLMVPPPALPGLDQSIRARSPEDDRQSPLGTLQHIRRVADAVRKTMNERQRETLTVVVALTKCDRYAALRSFPSAALRNRLHGRNVMDPLDLVMYNEQELLHDFVDMKGGNKLLEEAASINGTYFLVALSGTGGDVLGKAANPVSAPNRSLDPLLIALMRAGLGCLTASDIRASKK